MMISDKSRVEFLGRGIRGGAPTQQRDMGPRKEVHVLQTKIKRSKKKSVERSNHSSRKYSGGQDDPERGKRRSGGKNEWALQGIRMTNIIKGKSLRFRRLWGYNRGRGLSFFKKETGPSSLNKQKASRADAKS